MLSDYATFFFLFLQGRLIEKMNCVVRPNLKFNIIAESTCLAKHGPLDNYQILQKFPRMRNKSESFLKKFAAKIENEFGFSTRYWSHLPWQPLHASRLETSEKLSFDAVSKLNQQQNLKRIDAFILGTTTSSRYTGSQACAVMGKLGLETAAWDIKAGCSTSLASLQHAYALMALGYQNVLLSCAETLSKVIDPQNELTYFGLSDGGAALYLQQSEQGEFTVEYLYFSSKGQYVEAFTTPGLLPPSENEIRDYPYTLQGDESLLKVLAYEHYANMLHQSLSQFERQDIQWIIAHQVSRQLINRLVHDFELQHSQLIWHGDKIGNIGGASIVYSLAQASKAGIFNKKGKILMMSVGGGLTFACHIIDFKRRVS